MASESMTTPVVDPAEQTQTVQIRYEQTTTQFASQFVLNTTQEEIIVSMSAGFIRDPATQENLLPIQTRIALTPSGAVRLVNSLTQALKSIQQSRGGAGGNGGGSAPGSTQEGARPG